ncbi:sulfatase [Microbacterium esteraromaticum]|uniref:Sulfatase n=1 Tax=Microbacterium esteraromaticum TaxID=57043 RepID=A0A939DSN4_9MICO|nr:sulfatase [Microbacterium esteraromaticum]MBN8204415.1 sulfatase [Microbacterium esteraromaticum]MBN8414569.1 sulfatase [Microbacterium esteraromaticum]
MPNRPNILVIMADQFRASSLGLLGEDPVHTPHLDRLAAEGCLVRQAVSNYPVCSPHRAMFLTGMRPVDNGVTLNVNSETAQDGIGLRSGLDTWAGVLRRHGWRTGYIGKWHLEPPVDEDAEFGEGRRSDGKVWDAWSPPDRRFGFDFWYSYGAADRHLTPHYWTTRAGRHERVDIDQWSAEHETDVAIRFLQQSGDEPFALMLSLNPPHPPFELVPDRYRTRYAELDDATLLPRPNVRLGTETAHKAAGIARDYYAAVTGVDEQIGRLHAAVQACSGDRPTVIVFTSDHGMQMGSHELLYKNVAYEESMRLPFIVHSPQLVPAGESQVVVDSMDVAPTILGLVGLALGGDAVAGRDRSGALRGEPGGADDDTAMYYRYASRSDPTSVRGLRTPQAKIVATWDPKGGLSVEVFDLDDDPFELSSRPQTGLATTMARMLHEALTAAGDDWAGADALADTYRLEPMNA